MARTKRGYVIEADEDMEIGDPVIIPSWEPTEYSTVPESQIRFLGQVFGSQQRLTMSLIEKYELPQGTERLPDYIFNLPDDDLRIFLIQMYNAGGVLYRHDPQAGQPGVEVRIRIKYESLARDIQHLLLRLGIRTLSWYSKREDIWWFNTSGFEAYVKLRPILLATHNTKIKKRVKALDKYVPFTYASNVDPEVRDNIVELFDAEEGTYEDG